MNAFIHANIGKTSHVALILFVQVVAITPCHAQAVDPVYFPNSSAWESTVDQRHFSNITKRFKDELEKGEYHKIAEGIRDNFKAGWTENVPVKSKFLNEVDAAIRDLQSADPEKLGRFQFTSPDGKIKYFAKTDNEIALDPEKISVERAKDIRYAAGALNRLLQLHGKEDRQKTLEGIRKAEERWKNYLDRGFSQYPWEGLVNSWAMKGKYDVTSPPDRQWIVVHPELGVALSTEKPIKAKEVLTIEALGHLFYYGDNLDNYWGLAAITSLRDDVGIGFGGTIHFHRYVNIGVTWHDVNRNNNYFDDAPFVQFSIDLFKFADYKYKDFSKIVDKIQDIKSIW
jgi:hypothetical protein